MSFLYDRDYNVTGTVQTTFDFKPSYGTSVNFSADLTSYNTVDNYLYTMARGLNHLQVTVQMPFENRKEEEARKIASFFENLRGTGYFTFTDPASIYKPVNLFCGGIQTNFTVNDLYTIQVELATDQASSLLNWNGAFITGSNIKGEWATSTSYSKYDVVRYTGNSTFPSNTGNLYDCFYYCVEPHTSQSSVTPASVDTINWSKQFFFQPTYQTQIGKETSVLKTELPYSFTKRSDFGLHANTIKGLKLDFKGVSDAEARCILHFLASKQGFRRFQYKIPNIYSQFKIFFAPEWSHTFVYKNVNDISVTLVEDPVGKVGGDIDNIVKDELLLYFDAANSASYRSDSTSLYDLSANNNVITLENGPVFTNRSKGAIIFDGSDDYGIISARNSNLEFQPSNAYSVFCWLYDLQAPLTSSVFYFLTNHNEVSRRFYGWVLACTQTQLLAALYNSASFGGSASVNVNFNFAANANKWINIGYTYDGSSPANSSAVLNSFNFYLNGQLLTDGKETTSTGFVGSSSIDYSPSRLLIAARGRGAIQSSNTNITISNGLVYGKALTSAEVLQNFNASKERYRL